MIRRTWLTSSYSSMSHLPPREASQLSTKDRYGGSYFDVFIPNLGLRNPAGAMLALRSAAGTESDPLLGHFPNCRTMCFNETLIRILPHRDCALSRPRRRNG